MTANRRRIPPAPDAFANGEMVLEHTDPLEPRWIWPGWIARGMVHMLDGDEGSGKSAIANWFVSVASRKRARWPGDQDREGETGILVAHYAGESPWAYTTARDLQANKAHLPRVLRMKADGFYRALGQVEWMAHHERIPTPDLVVLDTWAHYASFDDIEEIKNQQITVALSELAELCEEHDIAALVLMHTRKYSRGGTVRERGRGGSAHRAVPRIVMSVEVDHADPERPRILARTKENLRISLEGGFRVVMKGDQSLTYTAVPGYGPDLIEEAMRSSDDAARGPTKGDQVTAYIDEHGPTTYRALSEALGWTAKELANALNTLPAGWSRRVTEEEAWELKVDSRSRIVERPTS
ncbi:MAG: AAA family ATPase [Chloroflexi bacterium]|nr:AAA family ATPase [Chloroflexota bacterium]